MMVSKSRMLKFVFMILFVAGAARATTLSWSMNSIYAPGTTTKTAGYAAYMFVMEQNIATLASDVKTTTMDNLLSLIKSRGDLNEYVAAKKTSNAGGSVTGATGYNGNNFAIGDTMTVVVVIFDASSYEDASHYLVTTSSPISFTVNKATGAYTMGVGTVGTNWQPIAVPEPATGTLMIISGAALFAGRRRRHD